LAGEKVAFSPSVVQAQAAVLSAFSVRQVDKMAGGVDSPGAPQSGLRVVGYGFADWQSATEHLPLISILRLACQST